MHEPDEEDVPQQRVERNELENDASKAVDDLEEAEADPVRQPLLIIVLVFLGLERAEASEGGIGDTNNGGNVCLANAQHHEHDARDKAVKKDLRLFQAGRVLDLLKHLIHF